jgi:cysteine synthase A
LVIQEDGFSMLALLESNEHLCLLTVVPGYESMQIYRDVTQLIGRTPLVRLQRITQPWGCTAEILLKLEGMNPAKSVKDRIAVSMLQEAESSGLIQPGITTIIEATSGNTGIGLAMVCAAKGYRLILTMPEHMSRERRQIVQAYGAEVILTPAKLDMEGAIARANELMASLPNTFSPQQFSNPANPKIHYETTGPEIWQDTDGQLDVLVTGIGTGGTLTGVGRYLKRKHPKLAIAAVEPESSAVLSGHPAGTHDIQGIGAGFVPDVLRTDLIDQLITVTDQQSYEMGRSLAQQEGIMAGISTGAVVWAAIQIGLQRPNQRILAIAASAGERYLSTAMWQTTE